MFRPCRLFVSIIKLQNLIHIVDLTIEIMYEIPVLMYVHFKEHIVFA